MAGEIVHFELLVKDADEAQAFWGGLFGWKFGSPMAEMDYRMAQIDEKSGAAIFAADEPKHHPERLPRDRRHRRVDREGAGARRHGRGQVSRARARLVLRLHGQPGNRTSISGRATAPQPDPSGRPDRGAAPRLR